MAAPAPAADVQEDQEPNVLLLIYPVWMFRDPGELVNHVCADLDHMGVDGILLADIVCRAAQTISQDDLLSVELFGSQWPRRTVSSITEEFVGYVHGKQYYFDLCAHGWRNKKDLRAACVSGGMKPDAIKRVLSHGV
jgi:hypothetical protein